MSQLSGDSKLNKCHGQMVIENKWKTVNTILDYGWLAQADKFRYLKAIIDT